MKSYIETRISAEFINNKNFLEHHQESSLKKLGFEYAKQNAKQIISYIYLDRINGKIESTIPIPGARLLEVKIVYSLGV